MLKDIASGLKEVGYKGDQMTDTEFNYSDYRKTVIQGAVSKHGSKENAIIHMDAVINDLRSTVDALQDIIKDIPDEVLDNFL